MTYIANPRAKIIVQQDKISSLEAELVGVRSQLDKVRAAVERADQRYADDVAEGYSSPEATLAQLIDELWSALGYEPVSPEELAKVSPELAKLLKEGRVS